MKSIKNVLKKKVNLKFDQFSIKYKLKPSSILKYQYRAGRLYYTNFSIQY